MANNDRYKVKGDNFNFSQLLSLSQEFAKVCVVNEKRHYVSVEGMTPGLQEKLEQAGGKVTRETRYSPE